MATLTKRTVMLALVGSMACSLGCSSSGDDGNDGNGGASGSSSASGAGMTTGNDGGKGSDSWSGPDGCTFLTQAEATQLLGFPATPCRASKSDADRRFDWDGEPDGPYFGSVGYLVYSNKLGYNRKILCGDDDEACLDLPGIGDSAFIETRLAVTYVQKGSTFFFSQCVLADAISAEDDAALDAAIAASGRPRDMTTYKTEERWREDMSCSRAAARLAASKL